MNFIEHILEPKRLLLVWQGQAGSSRIRHTVAELLRQSDDQVRFRYLTDTPDFHNACDEGFFNFPAFRKIDQIYDLGVLDTFMRRLPPSSRGDYAQYLEQFRLRPDQTISNFALLAYTGAKLPSDGFSIVNPLDEATHAGELLIEVAGFRHTARIPLESVHVGDSVQFQPESDNAVDRHALAVLVKGQRIGYVPRQQARAVRAMVEVNALNARVERVNGSPERPLIYLFAEMFAPALGLHRGDGSRLQLLAK
ncbi:MAG TPA: HIRAN domain-containing protein [Steroidobacteraceae bacterium]|nr:HIRAN domain-containing protein [Steroidobacteraceae bacterium]